MTQEASVTRGRRVVRLVIADDHPIFRGALKDMLSGRSEFEVVGEAADGEQALELCRRLRPDLVLMDARMPKMDGLTATRAIKREFPPIPVLMLTALEEPKYLSKALRAGAAGYVLKYAGKQEVIKAVQEVLNGESPIDQKLGSELLLRLHDQVGQEEDPASFSPSSEEPSEEPPGRSLAETLTLKELEVLLLVAKGQTNKQIAENLFISTSTVKKHVQHVITKLEVSDRTQAAVLAVEIGLLNDSGEQ